MPGGFGSGPGLGSPGRIAPNGEFYDYNFNPPTRTFGPGWSSGTAAGRGFTSAVVPLPTETLNGQPYDTNTLLVMFCAVDQGTTVTTPTGWTIVGAGLNGGVGVIQYTFSKVAPASDAGSTVTVSYSSANDDFTAIVVAVPGVDTTAPVTASFTNTATGSATVAGPTLTGINPTDIIIEGVSARPTGAKPNLSVTVPATWLPTDTVTSSEREVSNFPSCSGVVYQTGATDSPTWTYSAASEIAARAVQLKAVAVSLDQTLSPVGIVDEALGFLAVTTGAVTVSPVGAPDGSAVGAVTVTTSNVISPVGAPTGEAVPDGLVAQAPVPVGVVSGTSTGNPTVTTTATVSPVGIPTGEAEGFSVVAATVSPFGVASGDAEGAPTVTTSTTVSPFGVTTAERPGAPSVTTATTISPAGVDDTPAVGFSTVSQSVAPVGFTGDAITTPTVTTTTTVSPVGFTGSTTGVVAVGQSLMPFGLTTSESDGLPVVTATATVNPVGVPSDSPFGLPAVTKVVSPVGVTSSEKTQSPSSVSVVVGINPFGAATGETLGAPAVSTTITVSLYGISTQSVATSASVARALNPTGISSDALGAPSVTTTTTVSPVGVSSTESVSDQTVTMTVTATGIPGGSVSAVQTAVTVSPSGIQSSSGSGFSTVFLNQLVQAVGVSSSAALGFSFTGTGIQHLSPSSVKEGGVGYPATFSSTTPEHVVIRSRPNDGLVVVAPRYTETVVREDIEIQIDR